MIPNGTAYKAFSITGPDSKAMDALIGPHPTSRVANRVRGPVEDAVLIINESVMDSIRKPGRKASISREVRGQL